jgi:hypothetical protein
VQKICKIKLTPVKKVPIKNIIAVTAVYSITISYIILIIIKHLNEFIKKKIEFKNV